MINRFYLVFILVFAFEHQVLADSVEDFFQSLNSQFLKVATRPETIAVKTKTQRLKDLGLTWRPNLDLPLSLNDCDPSIISKSLSGVNSKQALQGLWQRCEVAWRLDAYNFITHSEAILRTDFEPTQHPAARIVTWTLTNGTKIPGLLFLKGPVTRPLVILRPGIFSSFDATVAERFLMMQIFDEGPYHLLVLPSTSSRTYIELNQAFDFGGLEEGLQTAAILELLKNEKEPLHQYINKIHLVGISLGGHGLWLTNFLQQLGQKQWFDRSLSLCPAVHLEALYQSQQQNLLEKLFIQNWFERRLTPVAQNLNLKNGESIAELLQRQFNEGRPPKTPWPLSSFPLPSNAHNHWQWNDFWAWLPPYDYQNTFVVWTRKDPVVPPQLNVETLRSQANATSDVFMELPRGLHCSLPTTYNWHALSLSIRGYLDPLFIQDNGIEVSKTISDIPEVTKLRLRHIRLQGQTLQLHFQFDFANILLGKKDFVWSLPASLSQQAWVLPHYDNHLEESLLREFSSRLSWTHKNSVLQLNIHSLQPIIDKSHESH